MKAVVQHGYGDPQKVLRVADIPRPEPDEGEVLVRMRATSVNTPDWITVTGTPLPLRFMSGLRTPKVPVRGTDVAGVVEAVGAGVTDLEPGQEVFGSSWADSLAEGTGTFAEYSVARAAQLVPKPGFLSAEEAAASVMSGLTAMIGMQQVARVGPGTKVLVNGASGGVGTFAVQIAKALGAEVTGVCSGRNAELVRGLGADYVIDYTQEDYTERRGAYDVVMDNVLNHWPHRARRAVKPDGVYLPNSVGPTDGLLGGLLGGLPKMALAMLPGGGSGAVKTVDCAVSHANLQALTELMETKDVKVVLDQGYDLDHAADAVAHMLTHHARGNVPITI